MTTRVRTPVEDVLAAILAGVAPRSAVEVPLTSAAGLVLAADVRAPTPLPPEARAAMDGVAVRAADLVHAAPGAPVRLRLDGASLAGRGDVRRVGPGTAREIATGAPMPAATDAVVRVEDLRRRDGVVEVDAPVPVGRDVRPAGEDAAVDAVLAAAGRRLDTGALGGLAGAGVSVVSVVPAARVVIVPTGDEVVAGTTPDAVGPALSHLFGRDGAMVTVGSPVRDDPTAIRQAVLDHARDHDVVVTVGGVSVGPRDHAGDLVDALPVGHEVSLALRPGRPFAWGRTEDGTTVLCVPGTPLAALATAVVLVRPVLARLAGRPAPTPVAMPVTDAVAGDPRRRSLVAAALTDGGVRPVGGHGAADVARLAATSALVDLPAGTGRLDAGASAAVWPLP